ncbi:MAG: CvpA family protein [Clostridiales Family XIII bacterium]|jgi:uncharacterized membrane protein required for colicin V production|nr:CvpA family protein [Clostridiales Family XIII bacterium]
MQIDIAIIIITLLFLFLGFKNGLVYTVFHAFGWLMAIGASFFFHGKAEAFLTERTGIYDSYARYTRKIIETFTNRQTDDITANAPDGVGGALEQLGDALVSKTVDSIVEATFGVFVFIGIILAIKLLLFAITLLLSKRYHNGFVGGLDGFGGMLIGVLQSAVIVFVLLALLMPVAFAIDPEYCDAVRHMLNKAIFADILYDHNPLLGIVSGNLPDELAAGGWFDALNPDPAANGAVYPLEDLA